MGVYLAMGFMTVWEQEVYSSSSIPHSKEGTDPSRLELFSHHSSSTSITPHPSSYPSIFLDFLRSGLPLSSPQPVRSSPSCPSPCSPSVFPYILSLQYTSIVCLFSARALNEASWNSTLYHFHFPSIYSSSPLTLIPHPCNYSYIFLLISGHSMHPFFYPQSL